MKKIVNMIGRELILSWTLGLSGIFITVPYLNQKNAKIYLKYRKKKDGFFMSKQWTVSSNSQIFMCKCFPDSLLHIDILGNFKYLLVLSSNGGKGLHSTVRV